MRHPSRGVHRGSTSPDTRGGTRQRRASAKRLFCRDYSPACARLGPPFTRRSTTHNREVGGRSPPELKSGGGDLNERTTALTARKTNEDWAGPLLNCPSGRAARVLRISEPLKCRPRAGPSCPRYEQSTRRCGVRREQQRGQSKSTLLLAPSRNAGVTPASPQDHERRRTRSRTGGPCSSSKDGMNRASPARRERLARIGNCEL